jgi:histidinol-phosphate aminotransferase
MRSVSELAREGILDLKPYSSARDEFTGEAQIFLDANESPFNDGLNRYPDPHQRKLKKRIAQLKGVQKENLFLGNGSDEAIDLILRVFCEPVKDEVVICEPTYGMYRVSSEINQVKVRNIPLTVDFELDVDGILSQQSTSSKVLFVCSPNNPTGNLMSKEKVGLLLEEFDGIVVVDEAYIDFANQASWVGKIAGHSRLIVLQTFSKAWGMAGLRLGMAFAQAPIIDLLNKVKPPYNLNVITQQVALERLANDEEVKVRIDKILSQRAIMFDRLIQLKGVNHVYNSDANFLLVKLDDADQTYKRMVAEGIILRNRSRLLQCDNCLRITIGTEAENKSVLESLAKVI